MTLFVPRYTSDLIGVTIRSFLTRLLRFAVKVFFRRVEVVGLEKIPPGGVIFAVNHPNGLVDPLFVLCFAPRPVSFLAKAPLWRMPFISMFVKAFQSIPVYRKQDNMQGSHRETFAIARDLLERGGAIALFPEGTTHSDTRLRELKTGAARIALGAEMERMSIVPTGIYYTAKHVFRSSALVVFGDPISVAPAPLDADGEPPRDVVAALTARIDEALDAVTLQADSRAALELIALAEDIVTADAYQPLAEELELRRRFIDGYHDLRERDPERLARLEQTVTQFHAELSRAGLEAHELRPRLDAVTIFRVLILLPIALIGAAVNYPTYRLIGFLSRRLVREDELVATAKFVAALTLYPLTYIVVAIVLWFRAGPAWSLAALAALPILGYIALHVLEDLDAFIGSARALLLRQSRRQLEARRREIRDELGKVAAELWSP